MKYSLKWLKQYVDIDVELNELFEKLSMSGSEVEGYENLLMEIDNVFIGKILKIVKHPNADKLNYCDVTDGEKTYKVVCGAHNIKEGDIVPFAKVGAKLPGGIKIKKSKIRGVASEGMLCSQRELGFGEDHSGIFILDEKFKVGENFKTYFDDTIFEIEVTPNRPDLLSHLGLAREIAVLLNKSLKRPQIEEIEKKIDSPIKVKIEAKEACPRYAALYVKNVKNEPSVEDLSFYLKTMSLNPKNILVDISNYNLFDLGHPTHFFDADKIEGNVLIRFAKSGEQCITIDGEKRKLTKNDLVIADEKKIIAIAGVMGCANSEVDENTKNLFIESAIFNPSFIRKTKKRLGINSDAAYRFERGVDPEIPIMSLKRLNFLLKKYANYEVTSGIIDIYPGKKEPTIILLKEKNVEKILNMKIPLDEITKILVSLGFKTEKIVNGNIKVTVPSYRIYDVHREIDLIEEIGRIHGFNNVPTQRPCIEGKFRSNDYWDFKLNVRKYMAARGFYETMTFTFSNEEYLKKLEYTGPLKHLSNPLNTEQNVFSPYIFPRLLDVLKNNMKYKLPSYRFFEISHIFDGEEKEYISFLVYGKENFLNWHKKESNDFDLMILKGEIMALFDYFDVKGISFKNKNFPYFMEGNSGAIKSGEEEIGFIGVVKPDFLPSKRIEKPVFIAEFDLKKIFNNKPVVYSNISNFPFVERDLSMVFNKEIPYEEILSAIKKNGSVNLVSIILADDYSLTETEHALMFKFKFQSKKKTLNDKEVDYFMNKIIKGLEAKFDARLR